MTSIVHQASPSCWRFFDCNVSPKGKMGDKLQVVETFIFWDINPQPQNRVHFTFAIKYHHARGRQKTNDTLLLLFRIEKG